MISFRPTEDEQAFSNLAKNFAIENIRPKARECEQERSVSNEITKEVEELGFAALELPESWGGLELPLISQVQILQALSYGDLDIVQGLPGAGDAASLIRLVPDKSAFQSYKEANLNGDRQDVAFIDATNIEDSLASDFEIIANGNEYVLRGTSKPVRLAASAKYIAIVGIDSQSEPVVLWLEISDKWRVLEGDYRLGLLSSGLGRIQFSDLQVGAEQVIARGDEARTLISNVQDRIRVLQGAKEVGLMAAALDYAIEYTAGRKAFGQEIAKFQGVSFTIADMAFEFQAAHHLVWEAALKVEERSEDAASHSLRALYRAHRSVRFITDAAVQMLGGHGYVQEFPVEKWMRDAQAQVALYGRERDLLIRLGEQILKPVEERVAQ